MASTSNLALGFAGKFQQIFGASPIVVQAPGRVNLIGEHTDYNDGFVLPAAIGFRTHVGIALRTDRVLAVQSENYSERVEFELDDLPASPRSHWSDYVVGVAQKFHEQAGPLPGMNLLIQGDVPQGAGLSSSASIEVAVFRAFSELSGTKFDGVQTAKLCQRAENEFVGARCGIMDQFVAVHGRKDHAVLLDCRSLAYRLLPIPAGVRLVICNTMVRHALAGGEYNQRRAECEEGARFFAERLPDVKALRDVSLSDLENHGGKLPDVIRKHCRHVISENLRVQQAAEAFEKGDLEFVGKLMAGSHASLRNDFQVSCHELDVMVELARGIEGVYGARMTGGGFGGCTINLVRDEKVTEFQQRVGAGYEQETGYAAEIYVSATADGAGRVT